jgi:hypothetical protein
MERPLGYCRALRPDVKPESRIVSEVCSLCGLDWKRHGKAPTSEKCVELLLEEILSLNAQLAHRPYVQPLPYPVPYPTVPWRPPFYSGPYWSTAVGKTAGYTPGLSTSAISTIPRCM